MATGSSSSSGQVTIAKSACVKVQRRFPCPECNDLATAAYCGHDKCLRHLLSHGWSSRINDKDSQNGLTALHVSAISGQSTSLSTLATHGANINTRSKDGLGALHYAAEFGFVDCIRVLIQNGADVNMVGGSDAWTALLFAVAKCYTDCVHVLLQNGARANVARKGDGWTPLHMVAWSGYDCLVAILVQHEADINARDSFGRTPLYLAAKQGFMECIKSLLTFGADIELATNEGHTPLQVAMLNRQQPCVQILLESSTNSKTHLLQSARSGDTRNRRVLETEKLIRPKFKRSRSLSFQGENSISKDQDSNTSPKTVATQSVDNALPKKRCSKCDCIYCIHKKKKREKRRKDAEDLVVNLKTENEDLKHKVTSLETQTIERNNELSNEVTQLRTENTDLKRKYSTLESQCVSNHKETVNEMKRLKGENIELKAQNSSLESRICALENRECGQEGEVRLIVHGMENLACGDMLSKDYARCDVKSIFTANNHNIFCESLQPLPVIDHMWSNHVLGQRTYEDAKAKPTEFRKAEFIWSLMERKEKYLKGVRAALVETEQKHLLHLLY